MLTLSKREKLILDGLLTKTPKAVAEELGLDDIQTVYNAKYTVRKKVQNAEQFLAATKGRYKSILTYKLKTPSIMPDMDDDNEE